MKKGTSKTFDIAPAQGYEIVNVNVDGTDLGPISYYTFQRVGVDHTISATFQKAQPSGDTVTLTTTASDGGTVAPPVRPPMSPARPWTLPSPRTRAISWPT